MTSPAIELQAFMVGRLKAEIPRVFDSVPADAVFPYVSLGPVVEDRDDADCIEGMEIFVQWDVWSRSVGSAEASDVAATVVNALHRAESDIGDSALVYIEHVRTRRLRDPDGLTTHCVVEFRAIIEQP